MAKFFFPVEWRVLSVVEVEGDNVDFLIDHFDFEVDKGNIKLPEKGELMEGTFQLTTLNTKEILEFDRKFKESLTPLSKLYDGYNLQTPLVESDLNSMNKGLSTPKEIVVEANLYLIFKNGERDTYLCTYEPNTKRVLDVHGLDDDRLKTIKKSWIEHHGNVITDIKIVK